MFQLAIFFVALIVILTFIHLWIHCRRVGRYVDKIPGPSALPVIGNSLQFIEFGSDDIKMYNLGRYLNNRYYPIWKVWNGFWPYVFVRHPDTFEAVFSSMKHSEKAPEYRLLHPWFGTGLLTSAGKKWQDRRKMLTPSFHFNVLQEFTKVFNEHSQRLIEKLQKETSDGQTIVKDLIDTFADYTLNTICETAMGTSLHDKEEIQKKYKEANLTIGDILASRLARPWLHSDWFLSKLKAGKLLQEKLNYLHDLTKKIVEERKEYHEKTNGRYLKNLEMASEQSKEIDDEPFKIKRKRLAMLDMLIASSLSSQIDDEGICEEVDTFLFEGHDTTAMAVCFAAMLLAEHKEAQDQARTEVDKVIAESDGDLKISDYQKMTYLEMCIKETLRLYPSVPFIGRMLREDLQLKDYLIPKGVHLFLNIFDVHRDPNYWTDPLKFDPDRFTPENCAGRHPFQYVPFSGGPRNCIGQKFAMLEMKSLFCNILHHFYLEPIEIASEIQIKPDLVTRPNIPIHVKFVRRNN